MDEAMLKSQVERIQHAATQRIEGDPVAAVNKIAKKYTLNETQENAVLRHLIEGSDLSRWGLTNAVTRASQDVESYDDATDMERAGGKIIELSDTQWREIARAA